jgi:sugar O-acyltransferase (sialic acid O-acetyltransferase NeuD family)
MKDIAIFGAGGFGREVACLINKINENKATWNLIGFFDDGIEKGKRNEYGEILGGIDELNKVTKELSVVIAIANPKIVTLIVSKIINKNIEFPNIISPDIIYLDESSVGIGKGNIISSGCLISCKVRIGDFNIFNGFVPIGHDTVIGDFNTIMPAVKLSGEVVIGNRNFFGVNAVVLQQIHIGNDTVIGACSLLMRNTKDGNTYFGIPAKVINY